MSSITKTTHGGTTCTFKRNIKRSPNGMKLLTKLFLEQNQSQELGVQARGSSRRPQDRGRAHPPGRALPSRGPLEAPPTDFFHLYILSYPKNIEYQDRSGVPPLQACVATRNLSRALPGTLPEGGSFTGGHLHHPDAIHDEEGVVHPRG